MGGLGRAGSLTGAMLTEPHSPRHNHRRQRSSRQNNYPTSHSHPLVPSQFLPLSKRPQTGGGSRAGMQPAEVSLLGAQGQGQGRRAGGRRQSALPPSVWARAAVPTPAAPGLPCPPLPSLLPLSPSLRSGLAGVGLCSLLCEFWHHRSPSCAVLSSAAEVFPQLQPSKLPAAEPVHNTPPPTPPRPPTPLQRRRGGWAGGVFSKPQFRFQPCLGPHAGRCAAPQPVNLTVSPDGHAEVTLTESSVPGPGLNLHIQPQVASPQPLPLPPVQVWGN